MEKAARSPVTLLSSYGVVSSGWPREAHVLMKSKPRPRVTELE